MPLQMNDLPIEVQEAFLIHQLLPDRWEGMSGYYMGKDMSAIGTLLDIYDIQDKKTVIYFIKHIENKNSNAINKKQDRKRKAEKA